MAFARTSSTVAITAIALGLLLISYGSRPAAAQNFGLVGWATQSGGTTGGSGGDTVTVSTGTALQNAINGANGPRIIYVDGTITQSNTNQDDKINVKDVEDLSIIGVGDDGEFNGIGIKVTRASNIIIQNLRIHHVVEGEGDCIGIEGPADHIWVDHCELYNQFQGVDKDYYDGLLDTKRNAEYLTFSWNYLHDSWKATLVGSSDTDLHDRRVTYHHNYFRNINSRLPLFRAGRGHVFNNYYRDVDVGCINSRMNACVRVENNYFQNAQDPWYSRDSSETGDVHTSGNIITGGSIFRSGGDPGNCTASIPYSYSAESATAARDIVLDYAGVGVVDGSGTNPPSTNPPSSSSDCDGDRADAACCTPNSPCGLYEGDCDDHENHSDCEGNLICGVDNCNDYGLGFPDSTWDCCVPSDTSCLENGWFPISSSNTIDGRLGGATSWQVCQEACLDDAECGVWNWRNADHPTAPNTCHLGTAASSATATAEAGHVGCAARACGEC